MQKGRTEVNNVLVVQKPLQKEEEIRAGHWQTQKIN